MKETAYLINAARGSIVDEPALVRALQEGKIAGAGLDTLEKEPIDPANPLVAMDNVLTAPTSAAPPRRPPAGPPWPAPRPSTTTSPAAPPTSWCPSCGICSTSNFPNRRPKYRAGGQRPPLRQQRTRSVDSDT